MKLKIIRQNNKILLIRVSFKLKAGSIKIHLILRDDIGIMHNHPWDFKSFLVIPYKEILDRGQIYSILNHRPLTIITRNKDQLHRTKLYRFLGIKILALTIGIYSEKKQLCSLCKEVGYCKTNHINN